MLALRHAPLWRHDERAGSASAPVWGDEAAGGSSDSAALHCKCLEFHGQRDVDPCGYPGHPGGFHGRRSTKQAWCEIKRNDAREYWRAVPRAGDRCRGASSTRLQVYVRKGDEIKSNEGTIFLLTKVWKPNIINSFQGCRGLRSLHPQFVYLS